MSRKSSGVLEEAQVNDSRRDGGGGWGPVGV